MKYLKELVKLRGVSGDEGEVINYIKDCCTKLGCDVKTDKLGNVIAVKKGTSDSGKKVMLCAHMDEVGLIIDTIDKSGTLKFAPVGGMDTRILVSKRVLVGKKRIPGVIGIKAIHLLERADMNRPPKVTELYIDIGAKDDEEAKKYVQKGDTCIFAGDIVEYGDGMLKTRALDDRAGCAAILNALEGEYPVDVTAVFSVQEEVGLRGATVAAYSVKPDCAIVLEGTTCADMHDVPDHLRVTRIGEGCAITMMDRSAIPDKRLKEFVVETADKNDIKWQYRSHTFGGTDAGAIQLSNEGVPVVNISTPCRYIHSPVSSMKISDFTSQKDLLAATLKDMDKYFNNGGQNGN